MIAIAFFAGVFVGIFAMAFFEGASRGDVL
jgi:hypothetical protein